LLADDLAPATDADRELGILARSPLPHGGVIFRRVGPHERAMKVTISLAGECRNVKMLDWLLRNKKAKDKLREAFWPNPAAAMGPPHSEEIRMSTIKSIALATVLAAGTLAAATIAQARDIAINQEGQMVIFGSSGQAKVGTMKSFDTFKKGAKPLSGGVVIFMHQGKLYMYDDPKNAMYDHATDIGVF
jgi:hypothetical protein